TIPVVQAATSRSASPKTARLSAPSLVRAAARRCPERLAASRNVIACMAPTAPDPPIWRRHDVGWWLALRVPMRPFWVPTWPRHPRLWHELATRIGRRICQRRASVSRVIGSDVQRREADRLADPALPGLRLPRHGYPFKDQPLERRREVCGSSAR